MYVIYVCLETVRCAFKPGTQHKKQFASLITGIYPAARSRKHVLRFPPYNNNIHTPVPGVNSPVAKSFLFRVGSLLCRLRDIIRLVPVRFWRKGHGRVANSYGILAGGWVAWRLWGPRSKQASSTWSNSHITGTSPAASARKQALFPPYKNDIFHRLYYDSVTINTCIGVWHSYDYF